MTKRKTKANQDDDIPSSIAPDERLGEFKARGGSESDHWNTEIVNQTGQAVWVKNSDPSTLERLAWATVAALEGIGPRDELEGMIAAQLIAAHNASMECYRRAMLPDQTFKGRSEALNQANKLSRTWATLLDALNKHRGKGQQKVTVEHVHVHAGGQAVVGTVERRGGGDQSKMEEQPHAKQIDHAPEPALRSADAERDPVPVARDGERSLPNARGQVSGRADRE